MSSFKKRLAFIAGVFITGFIFLGYQIASLQLFHADLMAETVAAASTVTVNGEEYPRGSIVDRQGRSITDTAERPALLVIPALIEDAVGTASSLAEVLAKDKTVILDAISKGEIKFIAVDLTPEEVSGIAKLGLPGIEILSYRTRYGPESLAVHLIGHLTEINEVFDADKQLDTIYQGAKGIEKVYDDLLQQAEPQTFWRATRDATGKVVPGMGFSKVFKDEEGKNTQVRLTIDRDLQKIVEDVMDEKISKGATVVLDVETGEVLAMASRPNYNQNNLREYQETAFVNRALERYYPGSVFKPVVAAAALEENLVTLEEEFFCSGEYTFPTGLSISCWLEEGHGRLTFQEALAKSCNPTFIEIGQRVGRDTLLTFAEKTGLTKSILLGYPQPEAPGINISPYGLGPLANASLGQQGVKLTPLQVASFYAAVANRGVYYLPVVVKDVRDENGQLLQQVGSSSGIRIMREDTALKLQQMLLGVTLYGTGQKAWLPQWGSAGKTSTAESGMLDKNGEPVSYAWFAGYAPLNNPRYVTVVIVEGGSSGGESAAPVFKEIMNRVLSE